MNDDLTAAETSRRRFVFSGLATVGLAGCGGGGSGGGSVPMMSGSPSSAATVQESDVLVSGGQAWKSLPLLANESDETGAFVGSLTAAPASMALTPGLRTQILGYNGTTPGPMIEAYEGDRVRVAFVNRLGQDSTVHWHGMPIPADQDGNPMDPVTSGGSRDYAFALPGGSAGSYWYHPHPHHTTHEQVFRGLASAFVIRSRTDPLASLPERIVFITDLRLDAQGQIAANTAADFRNGREGDQLLVNGARQPVDMVAPGQTERWRIYNATNARYLQIVLDGASMIVVALDSSMLAAPKAASALLLAPAQRADIVVRAPVSANQRVTARTVAYNRGMGIPVKPAETLFGLTTSAGPAVPAFVMPSTLPSPPAIGAPQRTQTVVLNDMGMGMGMGGSFTINGRLFDPGRDDLTMRAGIPEEWNVRNGGMMDHPLHIHGCAFQLVASTRSDIASDPRLGAFMDTVNVRSGESLRLRVQIDTPGRRMFHCHILEHEDQGMMAIVNVLP